jgi:lipid-A-disaccharide synthase
MKLYFIAGENSGDFIGAKIIKAIRESNIQGAETILFSGVGGNQMAEQGVRSLFDFQQINLMGFMEVLPHIRRIKKLIDSTVEDVINNGTDVLVTIDSPGFTFRVAQKVRLLVPGIKLVHIVAPSVWAYKPGRAKKYAKIYDKLLTLFPFEPPYFTAHGLDSVCIGHPILEQQFDVEESSSRRAKRRGDLVTLGVLPTHEIATPITWVRNDDTKIICITPGSRRGEISRHMPVIREALNKLSNLHKIHAIFVQPNDSHVSYIEEYLKEANLKFSFSTDRQTSFANSDVALAKSGTNTLEIAASGTPMIVGYKLNMLTYMIIKRLVKIKYASIINIIPNKEIIPEYIQSRFTADNIANALNELLSDKTKADKQVQEAQKILKTIGFGSKEVPSQKAAKIILEM